MFLFYHLRYSTTHCSEFCLCLYLFLKYRELPWQNFDCEEEIKNSKVNYRSDKIYNVFIDYVRSLDFSCDPDYLYIRRLFITETT